uniref:Arylamine N-acetyltransferase 3 n=1 Tax=Tetrahymena thermophila TaxID=5911 RepID=D8FSY6_TETTH|nr:TPA: arylamine N-acetyltransferase 3 [Tetrahymena thermophila]
MQSSTPFLLSEQETQQFLNLLQLEKLKEGECKLKYLEALVQKTQEVIPFQNLFLLQHKFEQRNQLSFQEIKKLVLTGTGGYCLVISPVFCGLLQSLGYQASLICGSCRGIPKNHAAILVNNLLENEDKYLVEVSIGFKNKPLKIDFDKKSELYNYSFGQFYFEWERLYRCKQISFSQIFKDNKISIFWCSLYKRQLAINRKSFHKQTRNQRHNKQNLYPKFFKQRKSTAHVDMQCQKITQKNQKVKTTHCFSAFLEMFLVSKSLFTCLRALANWPKKKEDLHDRSKKSTQFTKD